MKTRWTNVRVVSPTAEVASELLIEGDRIAGIVPPATSSGDDWQAIAGQGAGNCHPPDKGVGNYAGSVLGGSQQQRKTRLDPVHLRRRQPEQIRALCASTGSELRCHVDPFKGS